MRVLEINALLGAGSTGIIVNDIKNCLNEHGIACDVACSKSYIGQDDHTYLIGNTLDRKVHAVLCRLGGKQGYYSTLPTKRLLRYIDATHPDIVQLHNVHNNYVNFPLLLHHLAKRNITTVLTLHDCWFFTGGCFHYYADHCDKWMTGCEACPKRMKDTPAYIHDCSNKIYRDRKNGYEAVDKLVVVGVSEWISNEARKSILKNAEIHTIHNGIDLDVFQPTASNLRERLGLSGKKVIIGPASKWLSTVNKDTYQHFVDHMDEDMVLLLFGCGDTSMTVPANVRLYGFIHDRKQLAELYSMADVLVNCSREDTLSTINLEAQACGTPVVTYDSTGSKETVDDVVSRSVTAGNHEQLLTITKKVLANRAEQTTVQCRQFIVNEYDKKKNFVDYVHLFNQIMKSKNEQA